MTEKYLTVSGYSDGLDYKEDNLEIIIEKWDFGFEVIRPEEFHEDYLRQRAASDGVQGYTKTEDEIIHAADLICADLGTALGNAEQTFKKYIDKARTEIENFVPNNCAKELTVEIDSYLSSKKAELGQMYEKYRDDKKHLANFRVKHALESRAAQYQESYIYPAMLIFILLVIEASVNAYMLRNVGGGLLGGVFYAFSFSVVNIIIAFAFSWIWSMMIHNNKVIKYLGYALFFPVLFLGLLWNLIVAHFRKSVEDVVDFKITEIMKGISDLFKKVLFSPFDLDIQGIVLLVIGLAIFVLATKKFYDGFSDPYIGYTKRDWQAKMSELDYENYKSQLLDNISEIRKEKVEQMNERLAQLNKLDVNVKDGIRKYIHTVEVLLTGFLQLQNDARKALKRYRQLFNTAAIGANGEIPDQFDREYKLKYRGIEYDFEELKKKVKEQYIGMEIQQDNNEKQNSRNSEFPAHMQSLYNNFFKRLNEVREKIKECINSMYKVDIKSELSKYIESVEKEMRERKERERGKEFQGENVQSI